MIRHVMFDVTLLIVFIQLFVSSYCFGPYQDPHFKDNRTVIVQLFEWRWDDIARECEEFLGPNGYGGVQTSPPNENVILDKPFHDKSRPWYERYQPVSYKLETRSGNEQQFKDMVRRCNDKGVRIYADVVLNHMTKGGIWGKGTGDSKFDGDLITYDAEQFEGKHFNGHRYCPTNDLKIHDFDNKIQVQNCQFKGYLDLDQSNADVRNKQKSFLNRLMEIGVAGFRIGGSRFQRPDDLKWIITRLDDLNTRWFPSNSKPFVYHEVFLNNDNAKFNPADEYLPIGRVLEYRYPYHLGEMFRKKNKEKWALIRLNDFKGERGNWKLLPHENGVVMVDSPVLQRGQSGANDMTINFRDQRLLKIATAFMLAWPYYVPIVMSSYNWDRKIQNNNDINDWQGPPRDGVTRYGSTCGNGWVCEHRWPQIVNMVKFRNAIGFDDKNVEANAWWYRKSNDDVWDHKLAFSLGNRGFIVLNNDHDSNIGEKIKTALPPGTYCDVISGNFQNGRCTGKTIEVDKSGYAQISVDHKADNPMIAIHVNAKLP